MTEKQRTKAWIKEGIVEQLRLLIGIAEGVLDDFEQGRVTDTTLYGVYELYDTVLQVNDLVDDFEETKDGKN